MNIKPYIILESGMSLETSAQFFGMSQDEIKELFYHSPNNDMLIHGMKFIFSRKINDDSKAIFMANWLNARFTYLYKKKNDSANDYLKYQSFLEDLTGVDIERKLINKEKLDDKDKRKVLRYMLKYACFATSFQERFGTSEHFIEILINELEDNDNMKEKLSKLMDYNKDLYMCSFRKN